MKYLGSVFLTIATMLFGLILGIVETVQLGRYTSAVPYLTGLLVLCLLLSVISFIRVGKHPEIKSNSLSNIPPIHIENRLENIGNTTQINKEHAGSPASPIAIPKPEIPDIKPRPSRIVRMRDLFPHADGTKVLLVPFRNDSIIGQNHRFYAHIAYKRANDSEITELARASWFPVEGDPEQTSFGTKITRELSVFFLEDGKLLKPSINWLVQSFGGSVVRHPELDSDEIKDEVHHVEITLVSGNRPPLVFIFDLVRDANGPSLRWQNRDA